MITTIHNIFELQWLVGGAKRLVDEFAIESEPGRGTVVKIVKWKK